MNSREIGTTSKPVRRRLCNSDQSSLLPQIILHGISDEETGISLSSSLAHLNRLMSLGARNPNENADHRR